MPIERTSDYLAECFWPGVREDDLCALDERAAAAAAALALEGRHVRYVGTLLMRTDEVVLCEFEGTEEAVREVAERAEIPFDRILATVRSPSRAETGQASKRGTDESAPGQKEEDVCTVLVDEESRG